MRVYIGTSGWSYPNWKDAFYPKGLKASEWLSYYATHFNSIEVNSSFYVLPSLKTMQRWHDSTPENFLFAIKAWGVITHRHKLMHCQDILQSFLSFLRVLDHKCSIILFQFPHTFTLNLNRLQDFVQMLPKAYRYAFEFRHPSWWIEEVYSVLSSNQMGFCIHDFPELSSPRIMTSDFLYIRFHGSKVPYIGKYTEEALEEWAAWICAQKKDAYIYFNNTKEKDDAIQNASLMEKLIGIKSME